MNKRRFRRGKAPGREHMGKRSTFTCPVVKSETLLSAFHEPSPLDPHSSAGETDVLFSLAVQIRTVRHREVYASQ